MIDKKRPMETISEEMGLGFGVDVGHDYSVSGSLEGAPPCLNIRPILTGMGILPMLKYDEKTTQEQKIEIGKHLVRRMNPILEKTGKDLIKCVEEVQNLLDTVGIEEAVKIATMTE